MENRQFYSSRQVFLNSWIVIALLVIASLAATRNLQKIPSGIQNFMEYVLEFIRDLVRNQIGEKEYRDWVPFVGTLFCSFLCQIGQVR